MAVPQTEKREGNRVDRRHEQVQKDFDKHDLVRALREGTEAMRAKAAKYQYMLPNPGELEIVPVGAGENIALPDFLYNGEIIHRAGSEGGLTVYDYRIRRACMPNVHAETIRDTARLPFRSRINLQGWDEEIQGKEVEIEDGKKTRVGGWVRDMDGEGRGIDEWAADLFEDGLFEGVVFVVVDNDPRSFPDAESRRIAKARPYATKIEMKDVLRVTVGRGDDGRPRLVQFVFRQPMARVDISNPDNWIDENINAIKVLTAGEEIRDPRTGRVVERTPVTSWIYVENDDGDYVYDESLSGTIEPDRPGEFLTELPVEPFYGKRVAPFRGESPYLDTAWIQATIWNQMSELLNKARESSLSYVHESGVPAKEENSSEPVNLDTRTSRYRATTQPQGKLTIVEHSGEVLAELRKLVDWLIDQVRSAHHKIDSSAPSAPVTAREITLEGVHASSELEMRVIFAEHSWQRVLELFRLLGGLSKTGITSIPHDFGLPNSGMNRNHALFLADRMSPKGYWSEARRAGDVDERGFEIDDEVAWAEGKQEESSRSAANELQASLAQDSAAEESADAAASGREPAGADG